MRGFSYGAALRVAAAALLCLPAQQAWAQAAGTGSPTVLSASPPAAGGARSAQLELGAQTYTAHCALCHGADGKRGAAFQTPIWGAGTLIAKFGTAQGLFEYLQLLMPFDDPSKLNDEQKWAVTAYVLSNHGAITAQQTLGPASARGIAIK